MHPFKRSLRVGDLIREEVADIIMHKIRDPRLGFVTVTDVKASDDLKHAQVYGEHSYLSYFIAQSILAMHRKFFGS